MATLRPVVAMGTARALAAWEVDVVTPSKGKATALRVDVCPTNTGEEPACILFVLDSEPSLFGLAAVHAFAQAQPGYGSWARAGAPPIAVVGIGLRPEDFDLSANGWDIDKLRNLRRAAFAPNFDDDPADSLPLAVVHAIAQDVVPEVEKRLGCDNAQPKPKRCVLGASFTALTAMQCLFFHADVFDSVVAASPSPYAAKQPTRALEPPGGDDLVPIHDCELFRIERATDGKYAKAQAVLVTVGGLEHERLHASAAELARVLRERGLAVELRCLPGESHTSCKPAVVSNAFNWWQAHLTGVPMDWR